MEWLIREVCESRSVSANLIRPAQRHFSRDFPYAVIFLDQLDRIWIVAVMHMKRRPGYWRERIA
jgi:hypothetical protein